MNAPAWASNQPKSLLRGWKRERQMSATVKETVFLMRSRKEKEKDSRLEWEWGKE